MRFFPSPGLYLVLILSLSKDEDHAPSTNVDGRYRNGPGSLGGPGPTSSSASPIAW
jgi:hypothetical protein